MTVKEFKEWVNKLPEEMLDFALVIRTLQSTEEEGKFGQKDEPIVSSMMDTNSKRLCVFNIDSQKVIEQIRAAAPKPEQPIEGSDLK